MNETMEEMAHVPVSTEDMKRICEELVQDFDGTCLFIANELASTSDPVLLLDILTEITCNIRDGSNGIDDEVDVSGNDGCAWLSESIVDRLETDFFPQIVQLLLGKAVDYDCVHRVNAFFQFVLQKVADRLQEGDLSMLPTLVRVLDVHRPFYLYYGCNSDFENVDEQVSTLGPVRYALAHCRYVSRYFLKNLQFWGEIGGFSLFVSIMKGRTDTNCGEHDTGGNDCALHLSFEAMQFIFRAIYAVKDYLTPRFMLRYCLSLLAAARSFMRNMPAADFYGLPRDSLLEVVQIMELLVAKAQDVSQSLDVNELEEISGPETEDNDEECDKEDWIELEEKLYPSVQLLRLDLFWRFLQSSSLEKRIYGLTEIVVTITRLYNGQVQEQVDLTTESLKTQLFYLVEWMMENELLVELFGDKIHVELVKRCIPLFQFLSELDCLSPELIDIVWKCYAGPAASEQVPTQQRHEALLTAIQDLVIELIDFIDGQLLVHLLDQIKSTKPLDSNQLSLLVHIAARSAIIEEVDEHSETVRSLELVEDILMHLWNEVTLVTTTTVDLDEILRCMDEILRKLCADHDEQNETNVDNGGEETTNSPHKLVNKLLLLCSDNLFRRVHIVASLKFVTRLAQLISDADIPPMLSPARRQPLVLAVLQELEEYKRKIWDQIRQDRDISVCQWQEMSDHERFGPLPTSHLADVKVRLLALRGAWMLAARYEQNVSAFSGEQLDILWRMLVDEAFMIEEASLCFQWIEFCLNTPLSANGNDDPFDGSASLMTSQLAEYVLSKRFRSLRGKHITVSALCCFHNLFRRINIENGGLKSFTVATLPTYDVQVDGDEDAVVDLVTDKELTGLDQLWHLALYASDASVAEECITLLTRLYLEFVPSWRHTSLPLERKVQFIDKCMALLNEAKEVVDHNQDTPHEYEIAVVNRCVDLLRYFLEASDAVELSNDTVTTGTDEDVVSAENDNDLTSISDGLHKQKRVFQLENLEEGLQYLEVFPSPMRNTFNVNDKVLTGVSEPSKVNIHRRPSWTYRQQRALLDPIKDDDEENSCVEDNIQDTTAPPNQSLASTEDINALDGMLTPSLVTMRLRSPTVRVRPNLQWPQGLSPQRGPDLSLEDISRALHDVAVDGKSDQPHQGDDKLGGEDAKPARYQEHGGKSKYGVVSQLLANKGSYFDVLLQLVDWNEHTSQRTWELFCRLPTNNELLRKMIRLRPSSSTDVRWMELLDTSNIHRLLYALRLVEALLVPTETALIANKGVDSGRRQWRERFVRLGGARHLYDALLNWKDKHLTTKIESEHVDSVSSPSLYTRNLESTCLAAVIRTLNYLLELHQHRRGERTYYDNLFDVQLLFSTLPQFEKSISLASLLQVAIQLTYNYCSVSTQPKDENTKFSTENAEAVICGMRMIVTIVKLEPELPLAVFAPSPDVIDFDEDYRTRISSPSIVLWLHALLLECPSKSTRENVVVELRNMTVAANVCTNQKTRSFVEHLVHASTEVIIGAGGTNNRRFARTNFEQLFEFCDFALRHCATSLSVRSTLISDIIKKRTIDRIMANLYLEVCEQSADYDTDGRLLCGYLKTLITLAQLSDGLRLTILHNKPSNLSPGKSPVFDGEWIMSLLLERLLFGDVLANIDGRKARASIGPICKSSSCRVLVQELLLTLMFPSASTTASSRSKSQDVAKRPIMYMLQCQRAFQEAVLQKINEGERQWNYAPGESLQDTSTGIQYAGLINPGCICYMNALIQQLFMASGFRDGLLALECDSTTNDRLNETVSLWKDEIVQLQKLFASLASTHYRAMDPTEFAISHRDIDGNPTDLRVQMDADEFFCMLLDRLDMYTRAQSSTNINENGHANFVQKCFGGVLVNQILTQQGHLSEREENFFALSLEVSKKQHLTESLELYVQGESLEGENAYFCERMQQKVSAMKRICIKTLPQILVCHLKRFEFDFDTMEKVKINDFLEFPFELDMFPFTSEALTGTMKSGINIQDGGISKSSMYDLVGVVVHSGTADMGHYYSFIKDRWKTDHWLEFNDEAIRKFDVETMCDECFGGEEVSQQWDPKAKKWVPAVQMKRRCAYMLVYERRESSATTNRQDADVISTCTNKTNDSAVQRSATVEAMITEIQLENVRFERVVNAFDPNYEQFSALILEKVLGATSGQYTEEQFDPSADQHASASESLKILARYACESACQYVFGITSLRRSDSLLSTTTTPIRDQQKLIEQIIGYVSQTSNEDSNECALFGAWFLSQLVAQSTDYSSLRPLESNVHRQRTWLFDVLFLNTENPKLVDGLFQIISICVRVLTRQLAQQEHQSVDDKGRDEDFASTEAAVIDFYRALLDIFYERDEDMELIDPATGGAVMLATSTRISTLTRVGDFLESCVNGTASELEAATTCCMLMDKLRILDRFLFTFQTDRSTINSSDKSQISSSRVSLKIAPSDFVTDASSASNNDIRSCTLSIEKKMMHHLIRTYASMHGQTTSPSSNNTDVVELPADDTLLLNPTALKNLIQYDIDIAIAPLFIQMATGESRGIMQRDRFLSLLITVLEDVKTTKIDKVFRVFNTLLDHEELVNQQNDGEDADDNNATMTLSIHQHIFSPTRGILEAAMYYKDHQLLHKYTFVLLEFIINRGQRSKVLRNMLQHYPEFQDQVIWIKEWLVNYLDPHGTIRQTERWDESANRSNKDDEFLNEDAQFEEKVCNLFAAAETTLGITIFLVPKPHEELEIGIKHDRNDSIAEYEANASNINQENEANANAPETLAKKLGNSHASSPAIVDCNSKNSDSQHPEVGQVDAEEESPYVNVHDNVRPKFDEPENSDTQFLNTHVHWRLNLDEVHHDLTEA